MSSHTTYNMEYIHRFRYDTYSGMTLQPDTYIGWSFLGVGEEAIAKGVDCVWRISFYLGIIFVSFKLLFNLRFWSEFIHFIDIRVIHFYCIDLFISNCFNLKIVIAVSIIINCYCLKRFNEQRWLASVGLFFKFNYKYNIILYIYIQSDSFSILFTIFFL